MNIFLFFFVFLHKKEKSMKIICLLCVQFHNHPSLLPECWETSNLKSQISNLKPYLYVHKNPTTSQSADC